MHLGLHYVRTPKIGRNFYILRLLSDVHFCVGGGSSSSYYWAVAEKRKRGDATSIY